MKIRSGFVSNSSSSSFIISKKHLTKEQIWAIKNHGKVGKWFEVLINEEDERDDDEYLDQYCDDEWRIEEKEDTIEGYTVMDNFNMGWFLREIGAEYAEINGENATYIYEKWYGGPYE